MAGKPRRTGSGYRNRARGLLNQAKEHAYGVDDAVRNHRLRLALRGLLLEARLTLPPSRYQENFSWLFNQTEIVSRSSIMSVGQGLLFQNIAASPAPFQTEIEWISARLASAHETISKYLKVRAEISGAFLLGARDPFFSKLDEIDDCVGNSHWSIALRIAALQFFDGIEAQKAFLSELRKISSRGISAVFAFQTSVRNEPSVTVPWFLDEIKKRRFSKSFPENKIYLEFALLGVVPSSIADVATLLRVEQANTDIDLYETTISVAQALSNRRIPDHARDLLLRFAQKMLANISDPRLDKIVYMLSGDTASARRPTNQRSIESLLTGKAEEFDFIGAEECADDPASIFWSAVAFAARSKSEMADPPGSTPLDDIFSKLVTVTGRMNGFTEARQSLSKYALNFSGLTFGRFLGSITESLSIATVNELPERLAEAAPFSSTFGALDSLFSRRISRPSASLPCSPLEDFIDALFSSSSAPALTDDANRICSIRSLIKTGRGEDLYSYMQNAVANGAPFARNWALVAALELYKSNNDLESSLRLVGAWYAASASGDAPLPIDVALSTFKPKNLAQYGHELTTPLALEARKNVVNTDTTRRHVRLAFNRYMSTSG